MPPTRTEVVYEVSVEFQGRWRTTPPLTYDNTNFASHSAVIVYTVRVAMHCDRIKGKHFEEKRFKGLSFKVLLSVSFLPVDYSINVKKYK